MSRILEKKGKSKTLKKKVIESVVRKTEKKEFGISESDASYDIKKLPVVENVSLTKTRKLKPKIDLKKCQKTYNCFIFCPTNAITISKTGNPEINYELCDGCLICLRECPSRAIIEEKE
ncbi:MAG: 4Fe-4S binding protein [Candidatus Aenigmatarchaeota archaeon]